MIYYFTKANKDLKMMRNASDVVKNFVDYAHIGLLLLKINYLDNSDMNAQMLEEFAELLAPRSEK